MRGFANTVSRHWSEKTNLSGVTTASLLVVILVSTAVGILTGLFLAGAMPVTAVAIAAGFFGTVVAAFVRNTLLVSAWNTAGVEDTGTPVVIITYAAVASLAGSLAADRVASLLGSIPVGIVGAFAGLLSSALFVLLMVAYRMDPHSPERQW